MKMLLLHLGVLTENDLSSVGHAAPHALAARALAADGPSLNWQELWHVLRWYAHNRGYDGNSRWSKQEVDSDDTDKEEAALQLMAEHGTKSMAETICTMLELDEGKKKISSHIAYKTHNAAFPRDIVRGEVLEILNRHKGQLKMLDDNFINTLIASDDTKGKMAWATIAVPGIELPRRYFGGLLFGQLIPRFDNRIISKCPISGGKVPNKATLEFLRFRWAMIIANIRADGRPLSATERQLLNGKMEQKGRLTGKQLREAVESIAGTTRTNCKVYFELHPDSEEALVLDPALALFQGEGVSSKNLKPYWECLSDTTKYRAMGRWKKNRPVTLEWMLADCIKEKHDTSLLVQEIDKAFTADQKKKKASYPTRDHLLRMSFAPKSLSGRAPYSRKVMTDTVDFILSTDKHPTEKDAPLYRSKEIIKAQRDRPIDDLTNNHLLRQRLTILLRLVDDILNDYASGDSRLVSDIVVEVARDLQAYSGMTAKEMAGELTKRLSHFKSAVVYLEEHAPDLPATGSLIRKCRIAMDMDWKCPFTGKKYDVMELPRLEREHIIPYADRPTNSLDSLVLTFDWVNRLKGKRTGVEFIKQAADDDRILSISQYTQLVNGLKEAKRTTYPDDFRRQSSRKKLMLIEHYEAKDVGFTQGALTQTSHLNRLSARQLEKRFSDPMSGDCSVRITSIPGQVTAETRKGWNLLHTLDIACPECAGKNKTEIRGITHLHHALDAAVLGITQYYLPGIRSGESENEKGAIWQAMLRRRKTSSQQRLLLKTGVYASCSRIDREGKSTKETDVQLKDLSPNLKNQLAVRLAEKRVIQHIPADQSSAALEQNQWRVWGVHGDPNDPQTEVTLRQQSSEVKDGKRIIKRKETKDKAGKLVGLKPGKLSKNKAVLVIAENYGLALDPEPTIIPFHNVHERVNNLRKLNDGTIPRILRNGNLIHVGDGRYQGHWQIRSVKNNSGGLAVSLGFPHINKVYKQNVLVSSLLSAGITMLSPPLIGIAIE